MLTIMNLILSMLFRLAVTGEEVPVLLCWPCPNPTLLENEGLLWH